MRYKGLTESKFLPLLHEEAQFHRLHDRFTILNNNTPLTDNKASSKKMKHFTQTKMISRLSKNSLQVIKRNYNTVNSVINTAFGSDSEKKILYL